MRSDILFASVNYEKYDAEATLPAKFSRLVDKMGRCLSTIVPFANIVWKFALLEQLLWTPVGMKISK